MIGLTTQDYYFQFIERSQDERIIVPLTVQEQAVQDLAFSRFFYCFSAFAFACLGALNLTLSIGMAESRCRFVCLLSQQKHDNCLLSTNDFFMAAGTISFLACCILLRKIYHPKKELFIDGLLLSMCVTFGILEAVPIVALAKE